MAWVAAFLAGGLSCWGHAALAGTLLAVDSARCNSRLINEDQAQMRSYDRRGPRADPADQNRRIGEINAVLASLNEERGILDSVCSSDADKAPLFAQIAAITAVGLALESDIVASLNATCPAAAKALPSAILAGAWLSLANVVNEAGGTIPPPIADVAPKVQQRAAAVDLILPPYAETSAYWRDQVGVKAKAIVETCPSLSPQPTASPG